MSRLSGFVPINFSLAGKLLVAAGVIGLILSALARFTNLQALPSVVTYMSIVAIPLGFYVIWAARKAE